MEWFQAKLPEIPVETRTQNCRFHDDRIFHSFQIKMMNIHTYDYELNSVSRPKWTVEYSLSFKIYKLLYQREKLQMRKAEISLSKWQEQEFKNTKVY